MFEDFYCIHRTLGASGVGILNLGLLILKYSTLLCFHRVLHVRDSMKGNKVITCIGWLVYFCFHNWIFC